MPRFDIDEIPYIGPIAKNLLKSAGLTKESDFMDMKAHDMFMEYVKKNGEPNGSDKQALMNALRIVIQYANRLDESRKEAIESLMTMPFVDERMASILYEAGYTSAEDFGNRETPNTNALSFMKYYEVISRAEVSPEECPKVWMTLLAAYSLMDPGPGGSGRGPP